MSSDGRFKKYAVTQYLSLIERNEVQRQKAEKDVTEKTAYEFQQGTGTLLGISLEAICVTFWQIAYLHFIHVLKL